MIDPNNDELKRLGFWVYMSFKNAKTRRKKIGIIVLAILGFIVMCWAASLKAEQTKFAPKRITNFQQISPEKTHELTVKNRKQLFYPQNNHQNTQKWNYNK